MIEPQYISAFIAGLMSSVHCFGMCGGISAAFGISTVQQSAMQRFSRLFAYNSGRITCYVLLGVLFGSASQFFVEQFHLLVVPLRVFAGLMLIAMGCYVARWWMGISVFEHVGQKLWKHIQPVSQVFRPLDRLVNAYLFGLLWGMLPCGLVYSMLVWASASGHALTAAVLMLGFGLGTFPAMVATGFGASHVKSFLQHRHVQLASASMLIVFGLWTVVSVLQHEH